MGSSAERDRWQIELEREYVPKGVDASLIAALVHEHEQTYNDIQNVLDALVGPLSDDTSSGYNGQKVYTATQDSSSSGDAEEQEKMVEQLLQEWKLVDVESNLAENLHITDEEDVDTDQEEDGDQLQVREAKRLGEAASQGLLNVDNVAAGKEGVVTMSSDAIEASSETAPGLAFLMHAFPSRTPIFLEEMLKEEKGNVEQVIDTLAVMEMVENGDLDEDNLENDGQSESKQRGLDYEVLEVGTGHKKMSKNERRRRKGQANKINAVHGIGKGAPQKINLTDIRQGGPSIEYLPKKMPKMNDARKNHHSEIEDDETMAARLAAEERTAAGLPLEEEESDTVQDNDWLFSNSILDQLCDLLDFSSHKVRSVHNTCHFNLRATTQRLLNINCQAYPTLTSLDEAGSAPSGTASTIVDGLASLLPVKAKSEIERAFRGTKGRQDATLDLIQLIDVVETSAMGEKTDVLDPMKSSRSDQVLVPTETLSQQVDNRQGRFDFVGEKDTLLPPGQIPYSQITKRSMRTGGSTSQTVSRRYALEQLKAGAASTSFPLHSAHTDAISRDSLIGVNSTLFDGARRHETKSEAERLAIEYRTIANEYRSRREQSLLQAAQAYRSLPGGGASKQVKGAAAWVYADEARRLDAKARAFSLKAAQATVRHRMMTNQTSLTSSSSSSSHNQHQSSDVVDLHGLTVHESLSITKEALSAWWSKSSSGNIHPLYIVTGVGRHSKGHIAVIRPAILKMLHKDGWIVDERREGQITVKGLR